MKTIKNLFLLPSLLLICGCASYDFEKEIKIPDNYLFTNFDECSKFPHGEKKLIAIIGYRSNEDRRGHPFFHGDFRNWNEFYLCNDLKSSGKQYIKVQCGKNEICKKIKNSAQGKYLIIGKYENSFRRLVADNIFAISGQTKIIVPKKEIKKEEKKHSLPNLFDNLIYYIFNPNTNIKEGIKFEQPSPALPNGYSLFLIVRKFSDEEYVFCVNPGLINFHRDDPNLNLFYLKTKKNQYFNLGDGLEAGLYVSSGVAALDWQGFEIFVPVFEEVEK